MALILTDHVPSKRFEYEGAWFLINYRDDKDISRLLKTGKRHKDIFKYCCSDMGDIYLTQADQEKEKSLKYTDKDIEKLIEKAPDVIYWVINTSQISWQFYPTAEMYLKNLGRPSNTSSDGNGVKDNRPVATNV